MEVQSKLTFQNPKIPSLMNWKILRSPTTLTVTNINFQSLCELGKSFAYSLRPTFKNPNSTFKNTNFESKDKLSSTVENKGHLHIIRLVTFQT